MASTSSICLHSARQPLRHPLAPAVHIRRPQIRRNIHQDEIHRDGRGQAHRTRELERRLVRRRQSRVAAIHHPAQRGAQDLVVHEVDGEREAAEVPEESVGEDGARQRAEVQGQHDEVEAEAGGEAWEVWFLGEDGGEGILEAEGPRLPFGEAVWEGRDVESGEKKEDGYQGAKDPGYGCGLELFEQVCVGAGVEILQVGHEGAKEELHAKERVVGRPAEKCQTKGYHHAVLLVCMCRA